MKAKKGFFSGHAKSSAAFISLSAHAVFIVVALSFVAVSVIRKDEQQFLDKHIERPRLQLKKLQVPVAIKKRKMQAPKLSKRILSKPKIKSTEIMMPEIFGIEGGRGGDTGLGSPGFEFDLDNLFGGSKSFGNELHGTFYDLKQTKRGKHNPMDDDMYDEALVRFLPSWEENRLDDFFKAPQSKYTVAVMMPLMSADAAPEAFGVADVVEPKYWLVLYKGRIAAPETGRYRFCGASDDVLYVRVNRRLVLDACYQTIAGRLSGWESRDENNRKFDLGSSRMTIGDWVHLTKGKETEIEILIGERPGGKFYCHLLIEQEGQTYRKVATAEGIRPVLPVFKMNEIPESLVDQMKVNPDEATLMGPIFGAMRREKQDTDYMAVGIGIK